MVTLKIVKDAFSYTFNNETVYMPESITRRNKIEQRAFQDGAVDFSDGKLNSRTIKMTTMIDGGDPATMSYYRLLLTNALFKENYKLYLGIDGVYTSYYNIKKCTEIETLFVDGQDYSAANFNINLELLDPYLYIDAGQTDTTTIDSSPKSDTIANSGEYSYPVITVTADTTISSLLIENESDVPEGATDGLQFLYADNNFINGDVLIVDCINGTVKRNGVNSIRYFSGSFLKLLRGNNTLTVTCQTSGATTVKYDYAERYTI